MAEIISQIVIGFPNLSDPLWLQVIELLRSQKRCVCDLGECLGTSQSKSHLKTLKQANLVRARQELDLR